MTDRSDPDIASARQTGMGLLVGPKVVELTGLGPGLRAGMMLAHRGPTVTRTEWPAPVH